MPYARRVEAPVKAMILVLTACVLSHGASLLSLAMASGSGLLTGLEQRAEGIEHFSRALMNKILHEPSVRLKAAAANGRGLGVVDVARYLFAMDGETKKERDGEG